MKRACLILLLALALITGSRRALAVRDVSEVPPDPGKLEIIALPVLGPGTVSPSSWTELLVRITNHGSEPVNGTVLAFGSRNRREGEADAPFAVNGGATVSLRIPVIVGEYLDTVVEVRDDADHRLFEQSFPRNADNRTVLLDVARASALAASLRSIVVGSRNDPWADFSGGASSSPSVVSVVSPLYDDVTGDAILPRRAAGYTRISAVLIRSDELTRLAAPELEALAGYVMAGGTLAIVMTRPEDERHPVLVSLVGDAVNRVGTHQETLTPLVLTPGSAASPYVDPQPVQADPEESVKGTLVGFSGGNLVGSPYGASAAYGLGEVHLLAFDPQQRPGVDSKWVHIRMLDILRRANERVSGVLFRPGEKRSMAVEVRQQLDPNEGSRWAIVLSALLLCLYSVIAGPVNYTYWRRKGRPLNALLWLTIISGIAFASVVVVGVVAKGCSGRARHLTVVEAGAGMKMGSARRWRGFFVPRAEEMTIRTGSSSSVLSSALVSYGEAPRDVLMIDRDGLRLVDVQLRPWETLVIREDDYADLGEGIALIHTSASETTVINRSGRRLLGLVLWQPGSGTKYLRTLDDGASASSNSFDAAPRVTVGGVSTSRALSLRDFNMYAINTELDAAAGGLAEAWAAVVAAIPTHKNWFLEDVPVLLAQLEGGEGKGSDSGLQLDSDRVLLRIVGYGGTP